MENRYTVFEHGRAALVGRTAQEIEAELGIPASKIEAGTMHVKAYRIEREYGQQDAGKKKSLEGWEADWCREWDRACMVLNRSRRRHA